MGWAQPRVPARRGLEEESACGVVMVASAAALMAMSAVAVLLPRGLVLPVLVLGFAAASVAAAAAVARRTTAPPMLIGAYCGAPAAVMGVLVAVGLMGAGVVGLVLAAAAAVGVGVVVARRRRGVEGSGGPRCPGCGYSLVGIEWVGECPECGFGGGGRSGMRDEIAGRVWKMRSPAQGAAGGSGAA